MSRSNWKGTAGWGAIADPTRLMSGNVLVATAGTTATNEDYLLQIPSTGATFGISNYAVRINYAFPTYVDSTTASNMSIGLIARSGAFGTDAAVAGLTAQTGYIGRLNRATGKAEIYRRNQVTGTGGVDTLLHSAIIPTSSFDFGVLHTMEFKCVGDASNGVTLELSVDDTVAVSIGDTASAPLTSGYAGMQILSGTTYADNFTVLQYTTSGAASVPSYSGWLPTTTYTTADLKLWVKTDTGLSTRTDGADQRVASWSDQSGNSNTVQQSSSTSIQPALVSSGNSDGSTAINAVRFDAGSDQFLDAAASDTLNLNNTGSGITSFFLLRAYQISIGQDQSSSDATSVAPILNYGRSYELFWKDNDGTFQDEMQFTNDSNSPSSNDSIYTVGQWEIVGYVNGTAASSEERGFFKNGTQWSTTALGYIASNKDTGKVDAIATIASGGSGYAGASGVATTGGTGTGLTVDTTTNIGGAVTAATVNAVGSGYTNGDTVTVTGGVGANLTITVSQPMERLRIGRRNAAVSHSAGYEYGSFDLIEVILLDKAVTVSNRQKIEGYLAWKYGLTGSLPASHPYKNTAPS